MALHRDIYWVGRQWAVTGYGVQACNQRQKSQFDIEGARLWEPGVVERLQAPIVPHMGWNTVSPGAGSVLFEGLDPRTRFYFVHSYAVRRWELEVTRPFTPPVVTWAEHGGDRFVAAVENGPLSATQFHPEKSGDAGAEVLQRWVGSI